MVVSTIALAFIPILPPGPLLLAMLFLVGAFMMALRPVLFAYAMDISPPHLGGSVVGLMFTTNQIFAALGPILVGFLSDLYGPDKAFFFYAAISVLFLPFFILMPNLPAADRVGDMASPEPDQGPSAS
jgi:MFS family permease